jgi:15-cis-phytoene synthase
MEKHGDRGDQKDAVVDDAARATALDRYLAARLAPRHTRRDLIALAAFVGETARIIATASEPLVGEMRLQWWRDVLEPGRAAGEATGHPIADALREAIVRHALAVELFSTLLDARSSALEPGLAVTGAALDQYLDETEGAAFRLAARILGIPASDAAGKLLFAAGQAYGRVQLLRFVPLVLATRRRSSSQATLVNDWAALAPAVLESAKSWLQQARRDARLAPPAMPAVLPVALVEPYLTALERLGPDIVRERADISPLTRVWRLWWTSIRGKI